jgi:hypothetical protein
MFDKIGDQNLLFASSAQGADAHGHLLFVKDVARLGEVDKKTFRPWPYTSQTTAVRPGGRSIERRKIDGMMA